MKRKKNAFLSFLSIGIFFLSFLFPEKTLAGNISFSQSILPVRFVYLGNDRNIEKIWSNISEKDSLYALKFIDLKSQNEIIAEENIMNEYKNVIKRSGFFSGTIFPRLQGDCFVQNFSQNDKYSLAVDFITSGNYIEEVHTYT